MAAASSMPVRARAPLRRSGRHPLALPALVAALILMQAGAASAAACGATNRLVNFSKWADSYASSAPKLPYTLARVDSDWPGTPAIEKEGYWGWPGTPLMQKKGIPPAQRAWLTKNDGNMVLETLFPKGCVGSDNCSMQIRQPLSNPIEEGTMSYRFKFAKDFEFVKGGKMPGLCGGSLCWTGCRENTGDGWSARFMWRKDGKMTAYVYDNTINNPCGDDIDFSGSFRAETDRWYSVSLYIKMNTVGRDDGIVKAWLDGQEVVSRGGMNFRKTSKTSIDWMYFSSFFGGNNSSWAPPKDTTMQFDDFTLREGLCTPGSSGPSPSPRPTPSAPPPRSAPARPSSAVKRMTRACKVRRKYNAGVAFGSNVRAWRGITAGQCEFRCKQTSRCATFVFIDAIGGCYLKAEPISKTVYAKGSFVAYCD